MSSYISKAINPKTLIEESAIFLDNYWAPRQYAIVFSDGCFYKYNDMGEINPKISKEDKTEAMNIFLMFKDVKTEINNPLLTDKPEGKRKREKAELCMMVWTAEILRKRLPEKNRCKTLESFCANCIIYEAADKFYALTEFYKEVWESEYGEIFTPEV